MRRRSLGVLRWLHTALAIGQPMSDIADMSSRSCSRSRLNLMDLRFGRGHVFQIYTPDKVFRVPVIQSRVQDMWLMSKGS
jgi:hypothetical protein